MGLPQNNKNDFAEGSGEDIEALRQKIANLLLNGDYPACVKMIEENLKILYEKERWPDIFFTVLRTYHRAFSLMGKSDSLEERLSQLLTKNGIPFVLAYLLRVSDASIKWNADYFKNLAMQSEMRGDYDTALSYCDLVIKLDPTNSSAFVTRGWVLDDLKRPDEAVDMFEQAIELNGSNHSARNSIAKHYVRSNPQLALEQVEQAIELSPSEGSYYDTKAKILVRTGDKDGAIACYDIAMAQSPHNADYPYQKGEILLSMGKEIAAIAQFRKAMALNGNHMPTLWRLARLYQESQPELALTYINTILSQSPDDSEAQIQRGTLLGRLGQVAEAEDQFKQLLVSEPKHPDVLAGYADLILYNDPAGSLEYYDKAIAIEPKRAEYHMGKARALELLGQDAQAIKEYRQVVVLDKTNSRAFGRLASLLTRDKPREAAELYQKAIRLAPDNAFYYTARGEILMNYPDSRDEAISCFNTALKYEPKNVNLHVMIAFLLDDAGNTVSAKEHYNQAIALNTDNPDAFYRFARLLAGSEPEIALLHINSAISLDDSNADYYYLKSQILTSLGHDKHALELIYESLRTDPKHAGALNEISELLSSESPELAIHYMNRAIDLSPDNQDFICNRAKLFFDAGEYKKALDQYQDALRRGPKNVVAIFGIAKCYALAGDDRTLVFLDKAISLQPQNSGLYTEKANFLISKNKSQEALSNYDEAISLDEKNWEAELGKAKLLDGMGSVSEACECYKSVLKVNSDCKEAFSRLGVLLADTSPEEAIGYLDRTIDESPLEYIYHAWKGRALAALGSTEAAAAEYREVVRLGGETAETFYLLAEILSTSKPETALGYCLRAIDADGGNAGYHLLCGKIHLAMEQEDFAVDSFKTAIDVNHECHEAFEALAEVYDSRNDPVTLDFVNAALKINPDCVKCLLFKVRLLDEQSESSNTDELISYIEHALTVEPDSRPAREKLVELLSRKRSFLRLALEKRKLQKMKKMK